MYINTSCVHKNNILTSQLSNTGLESTNGGMSNQWKSLEVMKKSMVHDFSCFNFVVLLLNSSKEWNTKSEATWQIKVKGRIKGGVKV